MIPARFYSLINYSRSQTEPDKKITKETLMNFGTSVKPFDGASQMFETLQERVKTLSPDIDVECYLITSGFVEVARNTRLAKYFTAVWGCEFHYS